MVMIDVLVMVWLWYIGYGMLTVYKFVMVLLVINSMAWLRYIGYGILVWYIGYGMVYWLWYGTVML